MYENPPPHSTRTAVPGTTLGRSGPVVSRLALGTWGFGDACAPAARVGSDDVVIAVLQAAFSAGITFIDSADAYEAEARLGRLLRHVDVPPGLVIATKFGHGKGFSGDQFQVSVEQSLNRLGLDRIELMMIHDPRSEEDMKVVLGRGGALEALRRLQEEGVVRSIGVATGTLGPLKQAVKCGEFDVIEFPRLYTLLNRAAATSGLITAAKAVGMGTLLAAPFGGNILATGVRGVENPLYGYWEALPEVVQATGRMQSRAEELGLTLPTAALAYAVTAPHVDSVVVGITKPEQVSEDIEALQLGVSREQLEQIAQAGGIDETLVGGPDFLWPFPEDRCPESLRAILDAQ